MSTVADPAVGSGSPPMIPVMRFDNTLGALMLGGLFAMALWGVTCVQTYTYFTRPCKDRVLVKCVIGFLWLLDTFDTALNTHILYFYMVSNYMNVFALFKPVWSIIIHVCVTATSNFIIRTLFTQRVFRLSRNNYWLTGWIMAISLSDLVVGFVITVKAFSIESFPALKQISHLMYLTFAVGTGSDLTLAIALCYLLRRSRTGFRGTDSMISVLMTYTVNTGLIVAIDASLGLIMYVVMPDNFVFLGFYLLLSKLYLNSYLACLNARETLRDKSEDLVSIHLSQLSGGRRYDIEASQVINEKQSTSDGRVAINVHTLVDQQVDEFSSLTHLRPHSAGRAI